MNRRWDRYKKEKAIIYYLADPDTSIIFYVGKTESSISNRLNNHICKARKHPEQALSNKIFEILGRGRRPKIEVIEIVDQHNWQKAEMFWIDQFRNQGKILLNIHRGGRGW